MQTKTTVPQLIVTIDDVERLEEICEAIRKIPGVTNVTIMEA